MTPLVRAIAVALLAGTVLLGAGAMLHPVLSGDAAAQLVVISATPHWRAIHLVMLVGSAFVALGVWVRLVDRTDARTGDLLRAIAVAALALLTVGICLNALNIAYMAGAGTRMAARFAAGDVAVASIFDATHPIGQMSARFGNFLVALGAVAIGWTEWLDRDRPRWLAGLAWAAGAGGLIGAVLFDEASPFALGGVALLSGWMVATGVRALVGASRSVALADVA